MVGINTMKKHLILGECKWIKERGKAALLQELVEKKAAKVVPPSGNWQVFFLGFSREGWNENAVEYASKIGQIRRQGTGKSKACACSPWRKWIPICRHGQGRE